jgi:hypothetical protein
MRFWAVLIKHKWRMKLVGTLKRSVRRIVTSKRALALPVTFLILFVTTLGLITVTYFFSVQKINMQSETLKASSARQNFLALDNTVLSTLYQPGSAATFELADSDGILKIQPDTNTLTVTVNTGSGSETIFSSNIGQANYKIRTLGSMSIGLYLRGTSQTITNQTGSSLSQIFIVHGEQGPEIQLQYRPTVTYASGGMQDGKPVTNIRVYIVTLNSSSPITSQGEVPLKVSCVDTALVSRTYQVDSGTENFAIASNLNSTAGNVLVPISSTSEGAVVNLETVISTVSIERWIR